jgi:hypothetical protein
LNACCPWGHKLGDFGTSGNLPGKQDGKFLVVSSSSKYIKKGSSYNENSPEADN